MRSLLLSAVAFVAACSPPPQEKAEPAPAPAPQVQACNDVAPDFAQPVAIETPVAAAATLADLRGGRINPGLYDLARATRLGQATGWQGAQAVALNVSEAASGVVTLNWAGGAPGGDVDRWTATFSDAGEHPMIAYTCGRMGQVAAEFTAQQNTLTLRLPDGANGSLQLEFQRRS